MKKLINLIALVILVNTNVLTPFSYAQVEIPEIIPENEVDNVEEIGEILEKDNEITGEIPNSLGEVEGEGSLPLVRDVVKESESDGLNGEVEDSPDDIETPMIEESENADTEKDEGDEVGLMENEIQGNSGNKENEATEQKDIENYIQKLEKAQEINYNGVVTTNPKDIVLQATATEAEQTLKINKYFNNAYTVDWGDGTPVQNLIEDTSHIYATAGMYTIILSTTADKWTFQYSQKPLVPTVDTTVSEVKIVSMPSLADGFGNSETNPGNYFFQFFNYNGKLTSLPEGSFDTSKITTVGNYFFENFNNNGQLTSLPGGSFDTSEIIRVGAHFFNGFNSNGQLTSLPGGSFNTSKITTVGANFFNGFNSNGQLTSLPGGSFNTSKITTVEFGFFQAFNAKGELISLPEGSFDISKITRVGDNFFSSFNVNGQLASLPKGSFDISKITRVGEYFFSSFNWNGQLTSLPEGSFDTSKITTVGNNFFQAFNYNGQLTSLPEGSFDLSNITTVDDRFFTLFNYNGALTNLPESFKLNSVAYNKSAAYNYAFNSPNYTLNKKVSDIVEGITPPSSYRNTFSNNQPGRCGVHPNWLVTATSCEDDGYRTVTFNTNGGSGLYYAQTVMGGNTINEPDAPTKEDYSFAGWYDNLGFSGSPFDFDTEITEDITLYARRSKDCGAGVYFDEMDVCAARDENNIVYYWTDENGKDVISIKDPNGETILTMLDKNEGASVAGLGSDSYGELYQRGNNAPIKTAPTSTQRAEYKNYWPGHSFYDATFRGGRSMSDYWQNASTDNDTHYNNLWGGGEDSASNGWGGVNNGSTRQGPCATGYHVPSMWEREMALQYFAANPKVNQILTVYGDFHYFTNQINVAKFQNAFKLPSAGRRDYFKGSPDYQGESGYYWSSSPIPVSSNSARYFGLDSFDVQANYSNFRVYGYSVRCFKDSGDAPETLTLTFDENDGELLGATDGTLKQLVASGHLAQEPIEPTKDGIDFLGWTTERDGNKVFDFFNPVTVSGTLYAEWGKSMGYIFDANGGIFKNGFKQQTGWMSMKSRSKTVGGGAPFVGRENLKFLGANSLDVDVTLWPWCRSSIDVVDKYGNIQTINGKNYNDGVFETEHVHIDGDTIIFSGGYGQYDSNGNYISDYCPVKYSAVISGVYYDFLDVVERPTRQGYYFGGWYTLENGEEVDFDMESDLKDDNTIVYARWQESKYQPHQQSDPEYTEATLFPGNDFNTILKKLANPGNTSINAGSTDMNIKRFVRAENMPSEVSRNAQIISTGAKVYAWYDDSNGIGTIYYFSKADKIYMNGNSNVMFEYLKGLTNIDLSEFDTSRVTNMQAMFYNCTGLEKVRLDGWDLRKLNGGSNGIGGMFSNATNLKEVSTRGWKLPENFTHAMGGRTSSLSSSDIQEIDVTDWDLSNTTDIQGLFGDSKVRIIKGLDTWNTSGVINMSTMFENCSNLTELDLSGWNTSKVTNMSNMFKNCSNLAELDLSSWDTSKVTSIGAGNGGMFGGCNSLEKLNLSGRDFRGYSNSSLMMNLMGGTPQSLTKLNMTNTKYTGNATYAFGGLNKIEELKLEGTDTSGVTRMEAMFNGDSKLISLDLSSFDTSNVGNMGGIFGGCSKLEEINLSGWDFRNLNNASLMMNLMGGTPQSLTKLNMTNTKYTGNAYYALGGLNKLEEIKLEGVDTSGVTGMQSMFSGNVNLTELDLSSFDTSNVTNMSQMFYGCSNLIELDLSSFDTSNVTNMPQMFYGCSGLQNLNLDNRDLRQSTNGSSIIGGMFNGASNIIKLSAKGWKLPTTFTHAMGGRTSSLGANTLEELDVTDWDLSNTIDIQGLFGDSKVRIIKGLDTWNTSGVQNMNQLFYNCSNLTGLELSSFDTSNVNNMGQMFQGCSGLNNLDLSNFDTKNVNDMNSIFAGCSGLTGLVLDGWDITNVTSMGGFIGNTPNLKKISMKEWKISESLTHGLSRGWGGGSSPIEEIDVTDWDLSKTKEIQGLFADSKGLKTIKGLNTWNTSGVQNMNQLFQNCSNLTGLELSSFNTSNVTDMGNMFLGCSGLNELNLSSFNTSKVTNMNQMFYNTLNLKTIYASDQFVTTALSGDTSSKDMFSGTISVVGGNGTKFNLNFIDKTYALIDKVGQTGYFTDKNIITVKFINTLDWTETFVSFAKGQRIVAPSVDGYRVIGGYLDEAMTQEINLNDGVDSYSEIYVKYERNESSGWSSGGGGVKPATPKEEEKPDKTSDEIHQQDDQHGSSSEDENDKKDSSIEFSKEIESSSYTNEQKEAYEFAKEKKITTTPNIQKANMDGKLTRIAMAKMLSQYAINVLGKRPDISKTIKFNDVTAKRDADYDNGVTLAYQLGIMGQNMKDNKFRPDDEVTRAEFVTALSRLLYSTSDGEYKSTSKYYTHHMEKLVSEGIITKSDSKMKERRGYVMIMLMRSAK